MKKFIPMAVVAICVASVAFASVRQPAATVNTQQHAVVDTLPQDTTNPAKDTTVPTDTTTTDTSSVDTSSVAH